MGEGEGQAEAQSWHGRRAVPAVLWARSAPAPAHILPLWQAALCEMTFTSPRAHRPLYLSFLLSPFHISVNVSRSSDEGRLERGAAVSTFLMPQVETNESWLLLPPCLSERRALWPLSVAVFFLLG